MLALHAPDGFMEPEVAVATAVLAATFLTYALRSSRHELDDRQLPLAGITAAFVFAAQMVNFPVASGTTGHLIGAALAAILVGPLTGILVVAVVVVVQAILFADGGITALGYNLINMAIVPGLGGYGLFRLFRSVLPANRGGWIGAAGLAAWGSAVLGSMALAIEWLFGASAPVPFDTVFGAMVGVHALIGIGEAIITAMVVGTVLSARPDLVFGIQDVLADARVASGSDGATAPMPTRVFVIGGLLATAVVAAVISQFSFDDPDGLERVAIDKGMESDQAHALENSIFADYATTGIGNETLSLAVAGISGAVITLAVGYGLFRSSMLLAPKTERVTTSV